MERWAAIEGEWPLVGRAAELERVNQFLRSGEAAVVFAGPAGVGKTRLANEALDIARSFGFAPARVTATDAASTLPFGAFAPLLPDIAVGIDSADLLRRVARAVVARGQGKRVALLVDDAHLLDDGSAAATLELAATRDALVLLTVRSGELASDAVVALWKDGIARRLEVSPLTLADIEQLLVAVLGGSVDGSTVRLLFDRAEGNVLFLRELLVAALERGILTDDRGLWRLRGPLPTSTRLVELVEARLAGLGDAERRALEILALWEAMPAELFELLSGEAPLERLEHHGVVRVEADGRRLATRLAHPLYADVLRSRVSPLRARSLFKAMGNTLAAVGARRREDILRLATLRLDGGGDLDSGTMLAAAQRALALHDFTLAERLLRAAVEAGAGFGAELSLGQVLSMTGRGEEADAVFASLFREAVDDAQRGPAAIARVDNLTYSLAQADEALTTAEEAESLIVDPGWRDELTSKRLTLLLYGGRTAEAAPLYEALIERAAGRGFVWAALGAAYCFGLVGRTSEALAVSEHGLAAHLSLTGPPMPWDPCLHSLIRSLALLLGGRPAEAEAICNKEYQHALANHAAEPQAFFAFALSACHLVQGRVATSVRWGREGAGLHRERRRLIFLRLALMYLAESLALVGRADEAASSLAELDALPLPFMHEQEAQVDRARAWTAVARNDLTSARRHLEEAVATAARGGDLVLESAALHDLARLGRAASVAGRLHELAGAVEGPLAPARALHAAALAAQDQVGLEGASAAFEELGALLLAAEAAADAAVEWRRDGDPRKAASAERRAHVLGARCEGARTPALTAVRARAALTGRELEIARLAAAGIPNKEIAASLYVSLHTVQNNLHSSYEKLGIKGRAELAQALESC